MKKPVVGLALGLFALLFMLSSAAWAVSANEHYQVNDDVQSDLTQITLGNLLSSNEDNKQTLYTPLNGGAADGQWLDFVEAWQLAAEQGGAVTLQQDVLVAADVPEGIFVQVPEDGQVLLNLNGHRLIGEEAPCLIFVGARGKLTVMDSEQGGGQIVGVVGVDDSAENENEWGQIELLGGEIVDPNVAVLVDNEAAQYISTSGDADSPSSFVAAWSNAAKNGGTVKLLKDVTASGNFSYDDFDQIGIVEKEGYLIVPAGQNITLDLNGCNLNRNKVGPYAVNGYVIRVAGTLTVKNSQNNGMTEPHGQIIGGHTNGNGGGIYVESGGELIWQSGRLTDNSANGKGGGLYLEENARFEMSGGYIDFNHAKEAGGGVYASTNSKVNIEKGIIQSNSLFNPDSAEDSEDDNLYLTTGNKINVGKALSADTLIYVTTETKPTESSSVLVATPTTGSSVSAFTDANNFKSDDDKYEAVVESGNIVLKALPAPHKHALNIGCDGNITAGGTEIEFDKKLSTNETGQLCIDGTPVSNNTLPAGDYYVDSDINLSEAIQIQGKVNLCLNGHVIKQTGTNKNVITVLAGAELSICDCKPAKTHTGLATDIVDLTGGLITGGNLNYTGATSAINGAGICNNGTLNLYSGTIAGNKSTSNETGTNIKYANGGGVYSSNLFNMYGGVITKNSVDGSGLNTGEGGGVYSQSKFNMYGGKIIDNESKADGAGMYASGSFNLYNGDISNNKGSSGIYNASTMTMYNGTISENVSSDSGCGIFNSGSGTIVINGGSIKNNSYTGTNVFGGGIYNAGTLTLNNCIISGNKAMMGAGIYNLGSFTMNGGLIKDNNITNTSGFGAGVFLREINSAEFIISGDSQIYGNKKSTVADDVYIVGNQKITVGELSGSAKIGVSGKMNGSSLQITTADENTAKYLTYFFADDKDNYHVAWNEENNYLELVAGATVETKHEHNNVVFNPLVSFPNPFYYLTSDITLTDTITIEGDVNICLNGQKITGPADKPAFKVPADSTLKIYNCKGADFSGLSDSGGIEVAGGGTLNMIAKDSADNVTYAPAADSQGGKVTVGDDGTITKPSEGGEEPNPGETHAERHHELAAATPLTADSIKQHIKSYEESGYTGTLPDVKSAYDFLDQGTYYMEEDFTLNKALVVLKDTTYCLNGNNFGADNETWLYELGHVFWVPEKAVLNVLDCQRNLHIIWLYGGRVFLKDGGTVNMTDKDGWQTIIESTDPEGGFVKVEQDKNGNTIMTLPDNTKLTQKNDNNEITQTITNNNGVLEITTPQAEAPTKITPPSADASIDLKLPEAQPGEEFTPDIVLDVPADSIVQTGEGPEIKLEQPGEVAADGTVSSPEVMVTITDPETKEEVQTTITVPAGKDVQVNTDGQAQAPVDSTVKVDDVVVKIEEIGDGDGDEPDKLATVSPNGDVQLPPGKGSQVTVSSPEKGDVTIVIALPDNGGEIGLGSGGGGGSITPPKGSDVTVKNKDDVTIVIALPWPEDGKPPHIDFGNGGTLILPPGTEIKVDGKDPVTVDKDNPVFNPETGELTDKEPENKPSEPVNPNEPTGETEDLTPDKPVETPDAKVEMDDKGEITITPTNPEKPAVVIKPQPQDPDKPGATPKPPVVDETGKVFIDDPFKVETENGPDITADKGGSVDPDGNVTGEKVTVEQKNPDGTENKTTLTAPDNDAVKVSPEGEAQAPVGTEVENEDVTVKIDKVPDPTKPVPVKPDGSINLPGGSEITVTPQQPEQNYTVKLPEQGGEVKLNPDKTITLPPGSKVVDQNGKETTISNNGGTLNPSTGAITGAVTGGSSSGGGGGGSSSASYVITASASIGGEISPDKRVVVNRGADQTFTIKPADGYVISDVLVDGKSVGQVTSYTFENVRAGHSIQALFVAKGMSGHGHQGDCPKDETCPIWPYSDSIPTAWYHDGVHYCIEYDLMIGTAPALWEPNIPFSRAMMAQVLYNKAGRPAVSGEGVFDDVDQEWYWPAITWGGRNKVLWGYGDGNYGPEDPITREQLATLLWRYAGQPETSAQLSFTDAAQTSDYAKQALAWASQHGVITGYPDGTFQPQGYTSRAEAAQMIMRYFNL